jgi:hypothetical protein
MNELNYILYCPTMEIIQYKEDIKTFVKSSFIDILLNKYVLQKTIFTAVYTTILSTIGFNLIKLFIQMPVNTFKEALHCLPILVKINIMEGNLNDHRNMIRREIVTFHRDSFYQMWFGTFNYVFLTKCISGTVEIRNTQVFSKKENTEWLLNKTSNVNSIISFLSKNRLTEMPGWENIITCKITLNNQDIIKHFVRPHDIITEHHSHHINWEKKLVVL